MAVLFHIIIVLLIFPSISFAGQFKVARVYDGDTIKAIGHDIEIKVRLVGIDAPEKSKRKHESGQPYNLKATKFLSEMVLNKIVDIKGYGSGPYNRILGIITVDGKNVNLEMIRAGLAEVYQGKSPKGFDIEPYKQAEAEAKATKRGMWELGDEFISPKDWRKMHKK